MAICGLFALVLGYVAGLRFRVMVVLPLEVAAGAAAVGMAMLGRIGAGEAWLGFIVVSVAVQVGYGLALACPLPLRFSAQRRALKA